MSRVLVKVISDLEKYRGEFEYEYSDNSTLDELLDKYPDYLGVYNDHIGGNIVDYVIKDNKVIWEVPIDQCLIFDYLNTYHPGEFVIYVDECGRGGISPDLIEVLNSTWAVLLKMTEIYNVGCMLYFLFCILPKCVKNKIYEHKTKEFTKHLTNTRGELISPNTLKDFTRSRKCWDVDEFMSLCQISNKKDAIRFLYSNGYERYGDLYRYNEQLDQEISQKICDYYNNQGIDDINGDINKSDDNEVG